MLAANSHGVVKRHRRSTGRRMSVNSDREQTIDEDVVLPESDEGNEATKTDGNEEGVKYLMKHSRIKRY